MKTYLNLRVVVIVHFSVVDVASHAGIVLHLPYSLSRQEPSDVGLHLDQQSELFDCHA